MEQLGPSEKNMGIENEHWQASVDVDETSVSIDQQISDSGGETTPRPVMTGGETSMPTQSGAEKKVKPQAPAPRVESKPTPAPANSGEGLIKAASELGKAIKDEVDVIGLSTNK